MLKYSNIAIVLSFFCLWLDGYLTVNNQILMGFILIFSFGILHGANDILLITCLTIKENSFSFLKILAYYVTIIGVGIILLYFFPFFGLFLFVIASGFHFGEQQLQLLKIPNKKMFGIIFQLVYGIFILFLLFNFHQKEVQSIVQEITDVRISILYIPIILKIVGFVFFGIILYLFIIVSNFRNQILLEFFYLLVFTIIFMSSSLIWAFAIYFIIWHSIPSMIDQIKFLYQVVNFNNFKLYIKSAFWYWFGSLMGILVLYIFFKNEKIFNAMFFSFLAAITFPHVLVILNMFRKSHK